MPEQIFLVAPNGHLVPSTREVAVPATLSEILGALLAGPTATESAFGFQSFLSGGTGVQVKATVAKGVATVDFLSTNPVQVVGPDQTLAIAQVVYTATQQPGVRSVSFEIAGQGIQVPTASGAQVPGPVSRADYLPQRHSPDPPTGPVDRSGAVGPEHPVDARRISPEVLEVVERTGLVEEHVDQEVAVVHQHPPASSSPSTRTGDRSLVGFDPELDLVDDGPYLARVAAAGHHERIGDPQQLPHRENDRVRARFGVGGPSGHETLVGDGTVHRL